MARKYEYDINVLYNKANSPLSQTPDTIKSLQITERLVEQLGGWGFTKNYYHERDSIPGRNIFTELTRLVDSSKFTAVILTKGFVRDCWGKYSQQSAFKKLLDENSSDRIIPIAVGLRDDEVPDNLDISNVFHLLNEGRNNEDWHQLKNILEGLPKDTQEPENSDNITRGILSHVPITQASDAGSDEPHKVILASLYDKLREDMNGDLILYYFREIDNFIPTVTLRDIQDKQLTTTEQNESVIELVKSYGKDAYIALKAGLRYANQTNLIETLEKEEKELGFEEEFKADRSFDAHIDTPVQRQSSETGSATTTVIYSRQPEVSLHPNSHAGDACNNTLQNMADNGAVTISGLSEPNLPSHHTTLYTRRMVTPESAFVSLEMDQPPSIGPGSSMTIESGPKLRLPPVTASQTQTAPSATPSGDNNQSTTNLSEQMLPTNNGPNTGIASTVLSRPTSLQGTNTTNPQNTLQQANTVRLTALDEETELNQPATNTANAQNTLQQTNTVNSTALDEETELKQPVTNTANSQNTLQQTNTVNSTALDEETELKQPATNTTNPQNTLQQTNTVNSTALDEETELKQPATNTTNPQNTLQKANTVNLSALDEETELTQLVSSSIAKVNETGSVLPKVKPNTATVTSQQNQQEQPIATNVTSHQNQQEQHNKANVTSQQYLPQVSLSADVDLTYDNEDSAGGHSIIGQNGIKDNASTPGSEMSTSCITPGESGYSSNCSPDKTPTGSVSTSNFNSPENTPLSPDRTSDETILTSSQVNSGHASLSSDMSITDVKQLHKGGNDDEDNSSISNNTLNTYDQYEGSLNAAANSVSRGCSLQQLDNPDSSMREDDSKTSKNNETTSTKMKRTEENTVESSDRRVDVGDGLMTVNHAGDLSGACEETTLEADLPVGTDRNPAGREVVTRDGRSVGWILLSVFIELMKYFYQPELVYKTF